MAKEKIITDLAAELGFKEGQVGMLLIKSAIEKVHIEGIEKGHQEGWDDACCEYEIDESEHKPTVVLKKLVKEVT
ncbi:MAG: hypothetical protein KAR20_17160 [Candidatus Heimdallarchaeota archaeon]|nr:hypothetical protein [Candidatus Heimdallarchaeota archaeon]